MKKKLIISVVLLLVALSFWYFYPKNYHETFDGVYYQLGNNEMTELITIEMEGKVKNHIIGGKTFEGKIDFHMDEVNIFPEDWEGWQISFPKGGPGSLYSQTQFGNEDFMNRYIAGWVHSNKGFDQFSIMLFERESAQSSGSWSGENGFLITFPATNRKEALEISDEIFTSYSLDGDILQVQD